MPAPLSADPAPAYVWCDGALLPAAEARIPLLSQTHDAACAVFEGIRAYDARLFLAAAHFDRLARSADLMGYALPWTTPDLIAAAEAVLWASGLGDAYLRPIAWRSGDSPSAPCSGGTIHTAIAAWPWPETGAPPGLRLVLSDWRRPAPDTAPTAAKCAGLCLAGTLARAAARAAGHDDALMLDASGHVAATTTANIVLLKDGALVSPKPACFVDSLTKRHVFTLARALGLAVRETRVTLADLDAAQEVFVTGTATGLRPVISLSRPDRHSVWPPGPVTEALREKFHATTRTPAAITALHS